MASRTCLLLALVIVGVAALRPVALAQLGNIIASGVVPCSIDTTTITATTPVFPNAAVLLQCGGDVVASTTANSNGLFNITLNPGSILSAVLGSCRLVVQTPLASCNASLPSTGSLRSALQILPGGLVGGLVGASGGRTIDLIPSSFTWVP